MSPTISDGTTTITPTLITAYESARKTRNKVHELLGGGIAVSMRPAGLRTGTLELLFADEAQSAAAEMLHRNPARFTLVYPERPSMQMTYVLAEDGDIVRELDDASRSVWHVRISYHEVAP